ncbi:translation initiation factor IF-2-like isoform X1 [Camelus ferus]|uniref:Translation initiation factor IF-2-like isoform X1 n=1 Tax=Camelus ferus TaxID=419612 RepID=A0A8B8TWM1_CAMFR|nr:translation initiation factor IF-2-like isoform X1 [Camelus ferus]
MSKRLTGAARGHGCSGRGSPFLRRCTGAHHHLAAPSRLPHGHPRLESAPSRPAGPRDGPSAAAGGSRACRQVRPGRQGPAAGGGGGRAPPAPRTRARPPRFAAPGLPPASSRPGRPRLLRASRPPRVGPQARPGSSSRPRCFPRI